MSHHSFTLCAIFISVVDIVAQQMSQFYDMPCIESKCATQLADCHKDADFLGFEDKNGNKVEDAPRNYEQKNLHIHTSSSCNTLLKCIAEDEAEGKDTSVCTDGIVSNFSEKEASLHTCAEEKKCIEMKEITQTSLAEANTGTAIRITSISPQCIKASCGMQFAECGHNAECKSVVECLRFHISDGQTTACTEHLHRLDTSENGILNCAVKNKCIGEENSAPDFLQLRPQLISGPPSSLFEMSNSAKRIGLSLSQDKDVKKAEAAWEQSRKKTDSLLAKVHEEMAKLNEDLAKTSKQQKHDLVLLQESREKENKQLEETEKKLQEMAKQAIRKPKASFLQTQKAEDSALFAPLRRAADAARKFAADIKKQAAEFQSMKHLSPSSFLNALKKMTATPSSFIENKGKSQSSENFGPINSVNTEKANKSLSLAQKALLKLDRDLAQQKKQLSEQEASLKKEEKENGIELGITKPKSVVGSDGTPLLSFADLPIPNHEVSFLQLESLDSSQLPGFGGAKDPLSPEALQEWREKFEEKLRKAREAARAGLPKSEASSFLEKSSADSSDDFSSAQWPPASYTEAQENIRRGQREVERMQQQFNEGMAKLRQENSQLMAEAKGQLQKDREMQENLEAEKARRQAASSSLLQTQVKGHFDAAKEEEHIKELERKWKREAAKITSSGESKLNQLDAEQNSLIEQAKEKEEQQNAQLDQLRQKLDADLEKLHKDVAAANARAKQHKQEASAMIDTKLTGDPSTNFLQLSGYWEKELAAANPASSSAPASSVLQTSPDLDMPADQALSKAEADLKRLQEQLQSKAPAAMFSETKRNVNKLFANAKETINQDLPEDLKAMKDPDIVPPAPEAGGLNTILGSFFQKEIKAH